jgi:nitric oxide reductase activation protein
LQLRTEINPIKTVRKKSGKINKRQLHEAAFDAEDLFYKINIESHNKATLHITVDASSSMSGDKWLKTMTSVVAICKATSMIDNVHVTVSFRATQTDSHRSLPYVIMAYDSKVDKFSKVKNLFPYLQPNGCTPEGLAFEAIMDLFESITPDEEDRYFLNLSDGEPCYQVTLPDVNVSISYMGDIGATHTKTQVNKIRRKGVEILSYFISSDNSANITLFSPPVVNGQATYSEILKSNFQKMYGRNAKFINVESIVDLARTMNDLFLEKRDK